METAQKSQIKVEISLKPVHQLDNEVIVLLLSQDRSLLGEFAEEVIQRLNGNVSRLMEEGAIKRTYGETVLVASEGKVPASKVLLLGVGESSLFTYERLKEVASTVSRILTKIRVSSFATVLPSIDNSKFDYSRIVENFLEGAISYLSSAVYPPETTLTLVVEEKRVEEAVHGAKRIRSKYDDSLSFVIATGESKHELVESDSVSWKSL
ncbi:MAG: M17 family peptidase N-terminal domain-containing protein [Thermodesulfobacteriota bacterium]|nr:M17 family peptidase N-terminal domain-containing protein [Thermodesulfobacteriota bacterium]